MDKLEIDFLQLETRWNHVKNDNSNNLHAAYLFKWHYLKFWVCVNGDKRVFFRVADSEGSTPISSNRHLFPSTSATFLLTRDHITVGASWQAGVQGNIQLPRAQVNIIDYMLLITVTVATSTTHTIVARFQYNISLKYKLKSSLILYLSLKNKFLPVIIVDDNEPSITTAERDLVASIVPPVGEWLSIYNITEGHHVSVEKC